MKMYGSWASAGLVSGLLGLVSCSSAGDLPAGEESLGVATEAAEGCVPTGIEVCDGSVLLGRIVRALSE